MLIQKLADAFLSANQNKYSGNTRRAYHYDLGLFNRAFLDLKVEEVTVEHLRAFLNASADLTPITLARRQATLRLLLGLQKRPHSLQSGWETGTGKNSATRSPATY